MAGQIDCPAPLPEGPADALLTKMLTLAPYNVSEKTKKAKGTRKSSQRQASSDSPSDNSETHSSRENEEEEDEDSPPPAGGDKKRKADPIGEAEGSKKGRRRRRVATQGQAPGIVGHDTMCGCRYDEKSSMRNDGR